MVLFDSIATHICKYYTDIGLNSFFLTLEYNWT